MSERTRGGPIRFHFDYLSPYAYLAWTQIHALAERHGREVEPVPVLFAALLDAHGQKGPAEIPSKRVYVFKDAYRNAQRLGVPLVPPPAHPYNPLLALRVSSLPMDRAQRRALIDGLFAGAWGGAGGVTDRARVAEMASRAGLAGPAVVELAEQPEAKERVRRQTAEAVDAGVFGIPTMIVDGELFWGLDSLGHLERFLAGDDPIDLAHLAQWAELPAQATRPGAKR
jgi:2-hydroxychromene-2-carboxylate isomerase